MLFNMEKNIKKIFNSIKNKVNVDLSTEDIPQHYHFIDNFDNTNEEECIKLDNKNKDIYKHNIDLYKSISEKLKKHNAMIKLETAPAPPPQPNNYEKYIMHKTRNILKNVRYQSYAICYLINKGYRLFFDRPENKTDKDFERYLMYAGIKNTKINSDDSNSDNDRTVMIVIKQVL